MPIQVLKLQSPQMAKCGEPMSNLTGRGPFEGGLYEESGGMALGQATLSYEAWALGTVGICGEARQKRHMTLAKMAEKSGSRHPRTRLALPDSPDRRHRVREKVWRENYVGAGEPSPHIE
jgi:hypothetical protein